MEVFVVVETQFGPGCLAEWARNFLPIHKADLNLPKPSCQASTKLVDVTNKEEAVP